MLLALQQIVNNLSSSIIAGQGDVQPSRESSTSCFIEAFWSVCCSNKQNHLAIFAFSAAIKLYQKLGFYPPTCIMLSIGSCTQQGVNFINKDDARCFSSCKCEQNFDQFFTFSDPF